MTGRTNMPETIHPKIDWRTMKTNSREQWVIGGLRDSLCRLTTKKRVWKNNGRFCIS